MQTQTRLMTAEEFYEWANQPANRGRICELEKGVIVEMSRPGKRHGMACGNVAGILRNYSAARKWGYVCNNDTGVVLTRNPDTVRGPDILVFNDAESALDVEEKYGETPPILAVEVLSPNDTYSIVRRRVRELFRLGTKLIWIVDPDSKNVTVHHPNEDLSLEGDDELTGNGVLEGFSCRVSEFFNLPGR